MATSVLLPASTTRGRLPRSLCLVVALSATTAVAMAQAPARVGGALVERGSRTPIEGARISVLGTNLGTSTNQNGVFEIVNVPPGVRVLQVRAIGYQVGSWMVDLLEGQVLRDTFAIDRRVYEMDTVTVTAEAVQIGWRTEAGFLERRARGHGVFITREEIRSRQAQTITDLVRGVPGVSTNAGVIRMARVGRVPCSPEYFLDGFSATNSTGPGFPIQQIRAVEVYRDRFETPAEYQRPGQTCGVIAIWTVEPGQPLERR